MTASVFHAVLAIASATVVYYLYFYLSHFKAVSRFVDLLVPKLEEHEAVEFLSAKLTGFILLGVLPLTFFLIFLPLKPADLGLSWANTGRYWYLLIGIPVVAATVMSQTAKNPKNQAVYPQMRIANWTFNNIFISFSGWTLYLISYEFLFRGLLWFLCYAAFGFWPALAINLAMYSAFHMPKGIGETLGAIPLGAIVCLFTWLTGSVFLAFLTHICIAMSSEMFSIYYNPEMSFSLRIKRISA